MTTQQSLSEFQAQQKQQTPPTDQSAPSNHSPDIEPSTTSFQKPPAEYPASTVSTLADSTHSVGLWMNGTEHTVCFAMIGGTPGMKSDSNASKVAPLTQFLERWIDRPIVVTGGGSGTPMGHGRSFCRLTNVEQDNNELYIESEELYYEDGTPTRDTRRRRIGPYQIGVPVTGRDCWTLIEALSAWEQDDVEYLNPKRAIQARRRREIREQFDALAPGDRLNVPIYETGLEVISEQFDTHAVIPRGTLSSRTVAVRALVVSNPRGGYYQLGLETTGDGDSIPSCYIGISNQHPPTPNTAFTRDNRFAASELSVTPMGNPTDQRVVEPDEDILESPLPEPRLQTPINEIGGVGEKTSRKLMDFFKQRVTVERLAYSVFGAGEPSVGTADDILDVLKSLPQNEAIIDQLQSHELATEV